MTQLDSRIPLAVQPVDLADSLMKGLNVGNTLRNAIGGEQMTPYQSGMLDVARQRLAQESQAPALTPYQTANLLMQRERLDKAPPKSTIEGIRAKLASGEALAPGEQRVYDDANSMSAFDRILIGAGGGGSIATPPPGEAPPALRGLSPQPQQNAPDPLGGPMAGPLRSGTLGFESNPQRRRVGQTYNLPDGRRAVWQQDQQGNTGWELLD